VFDHGLLYDGACTEAPGRVTAGYSQKDNSRNWQLVGCLSRRSRSQTGNFETNCPEVNN